MDRRRFISTLAATGASASLAGCSNPLSDGSTPERDPENAVMDELYTAAGELNTAALALGTVSADIDAPEDVEFDESGTRDRIETARSAIENAAEADDANSFETEIEQARSYADAIEAMVDAFVALLDGATALSGLDDEFDPDALGDVRTALDESREPLETAVSESDAASAAIESTDETVLNDLDAEMERVADAVDELVRVSETLSELSGGYATLVDGIDDLKTGQQQLENREFTAAEQSFAAAGTSFESADATFDAERAPESEFDGRFETAQCRSGHLVDAAGSFEEATAAADSGDLATAQRKREEGEQQVEDAQNC